MSCSNPDRSRGSRRGAAAVEFALVGPLFVLLLLGLVVYGGWFWLAQNVQSLAAEGARAAVGGLDPAERESLVRAVVADGAEAAGLPTGEVTTTVAAGADSVRVTVSYDAAGHPLMALSGLVPAPPRTIVRAAEVRTGGY